MHISLDSCFILIKQKDKESHSKYFIDKHTLAIKDNGLSALFL